MRAPTRGFAARQVLSVSALIASGPALPPSPAGAEVRPLLQRFAVDAAASDSNRYLQLGKSFHTRWFNGETSELSGESLYLNGVCPRRNLLRGALWATGMYYGRGTVSCASAYTVSQVKPDERDTYAEAQNSNGPLRVLWVGSGALDERSGVFKDLFLAGNEVTALDLRMPDASDLSAATAYATERGYRLRFEQGDATNLKFADGSFDVVVCSMFLCQGEGEGWRVRVRMRVRVVWGWYGLIFEG